MISFDKMLLMLRIVRSNFYIAKYVIEYCDIGNNVIFWMGDHGWLIHIDLPYKGLLI